MVRSRVGLGGTLAAVAVAAVLLLPSGPPAQAANCSDDAQPCSPRCVRLGGLYDQRYRAVNRAHRKLVRNSRELSRAELADPMNRDRVRKLKRREATLQKAHDRRYARLTRTYRRFLACFD